jgi:hypothetical protein
MADLKMQIAFANVLRKKADTAAVAPPATASGGPNATRPRDVAAPGLEKRAGRSPRKVGNLRPKR